ncbi:MAG: ABC transporter ATP-binding protein [Hyphomicrobiales bacterium]|nr:ATP-binding cassette domain-containing protein [Hyphomicrobiales bacterium]PCJ90474.1 MAG: ABC transporter ATP-binding protein [Hyphomicrobiales bacterium]
MPDSNIISLQNWTGKPAQNTIVQLEDVVLDSESRRLVDGISLTLRSGGITALMGSNGAGKTLTLRLIARLLQPSSGIVRNCSIEERDIAFVFQRPVLLRRTVAANLLHALKLCKVPRHNRRERIQLLLDISRLSEMANSPARMLSGGEQQRLAMVRAIAGNPKLLLLDEPTASLDPHATSMLENLMTTIANSGTKLVLVTHDAGQARRLSSDVVFMHEGRIAEHTPTHQFLNTPQSDEAKAYLEGRLLV